MCPPSRRCWARLTCAARTPRPGIWSAGQPLDTVHVRWLKPLHMTKLDVEGARLEQEHIGQDYRIYRFDHPMAPLEVRRITFETLREQQGFRNSDNERRIVDNFELISAWASTQKPWPAQCRSC